MRRGRTARLPLHCPGPSLGEQVCQEGQQVPYPALPQPQGPPHAKAHSQGELHMGDCMSQSQHLYTPTSMIHITVQARYVCM